MARHQKHYRRKHRAIKTRVNGRVVRRNARKRGKVE